MRDNECMPNLGGRQVQAEDSGRDGSRWAHTTRLGGVGWRLRTGWAKLEREGREEASGKKQKILGEMEADWAYTTRLGGVGCRARKARVRQAELVGGFALAARQARLEQKHGG